MAWSVTRYIGGKEYKLVKRGLTKAQAKNLAKERRRKYGMNYRVASLDGKYAVYVRKYSSLIT